ncbi:VanZ family protein [Flavobacteriaceae bacterium]|nr:VanZ family protein [Flavobacteriaceae bacterium]
MITKRSSVRKSIVIHAVTIFYTLTIGVLSLVRLTVVPKFNTGYDDKIAHFLMYAIFCLTWFMSLYTLKKKSSLLIASLLAIGFGTVIEILQSIVSIYRTTELLDIVANCLGVLTMALLIYVKKEVIVKKL